MTDDDPYGRLVLDHPDATQRLMDDVMLPQYGTPPAQAEPEPAAIGDGDAVAWHYANARELLDTAGRLLDLEQAHRHQGRQERIDTIVASAQVHATLALAVSTREQTVALWRAR